MNGNDREMPKYKSHKTVWALKIERVEPSCGSRPAGPQDETDGGAIITPVESGYEPFKVDVEYVRKHNPQPGGYFVRYKDGYQSFSPAEAFENGYSRI